MYKKPIVVIGAPRSGTSITTRILQGHIGDFPFEVNKHAEPVELVDMENNFLIRHGVVPDDFNAEYNRLYFPHLTPDYQLFSDVMHFFKKYSYVRCIIKSPIFSIIANWIQIPLMYKTVIVERDYEKVRESLMHHKQLSQEKVVDITNWHSENVSNFKVMRNLKSQEVFFTSDKDTYEFRMQEAVKFCGFKWRQEIFDMHWDKEKIQYYKK